MCCQRLLQNKYEGESIIRNAVTFVFLLAALSFLRASLDVVTSYHSCAGLKLLGQFLCPNRNVNHGRSTFRLHQGRAAFSDPFFVLWRCIRGRNTSQTFSTTLEQCFAATECLRMDRKIKKCSHKCYAWRKRCVRGSLLSQKHFFPEGIKKLVQRWKKCIEEQGDYVEKWCYCKFYILLK